MSFFVFMGYASAPFEEKHKISLLEESYAATTSDRVFPQL